MNRSTVANRWNLELIEDNYRRWSDDPASVDATWQAFFEGYELAQGGEDRSGCSIEGGAAQAAVTRLIDTYRASGHYLADLDPLKLTPPGDPNGLLDPATFGLTEAELDRSFHTSPLFDPPRATLRDLIEALRETYCRTVGVEFMHIRKPQVRAWLTERMEACRNRPNLDIRQKRRIILKLNAAELFETFLHGHYVGAKRFSLEGGESLIPLLDALIERSARYGVKEIVLGMPHRGRLNVLANTLDKPYGMIFGEFEDNQPETYAGDGDVKYHLGFSADHVSADGQSTVHLSLTPNPSHLEAVNPVVEGRMRAKQRRFKDCDRKLGVPVLIHGDAAFAGQGLVAETLNLSQLKGYRTGGTVHIVVNNQIGFTTSPVDSRSTRYCTDIAKMIEVPIFHVNGDDPEAVVYVAELALDFRETFGEDVVIDLVCYRKHGHNENDEPAFTQPLMYAAIQQRPTIRAIYTDKLIASGELTSEEADTIAETFRDKLQAVYDEVHDHAAKIPPTPGFGGHWKGLKPSYSFAPVDTGVPVETLRAITRATATIPDDFHVNPKIKRQLDARLKSFESGEGFDWGFGEALAFGSLLAEGVPVRLSGQDSRRGTFSHRHAVLVDGTNARTYTPLNAVSNSGTEICVYDSLLSEAAVLGFDYGYSLDEPNMLILWEAQFGDFANGAQVIIDQFIASAESKWGRASGLVMLLPHGYEGQGPEHSSARLERFLASCADDNIQVVHPTTPAQYFHLLRRQIKRDFRKPLVVMTPKSLLRAKQAVSSLADFATGRFLEVIDDSVAADRVKRVVLCSGKVYYDLMTHREKSNKGREVAILRLEQFYPWPSEALKAALGRYRAAREWVWCQEESQNMGGWTFAGPRLRDLTGQDFQYVGRDASASPATGSHTIHDREQEELVEAAIGAAIPHLVTAKPAAARPAVALTSKD